MQGKEPLPWFCQHWRGCMIVLVWGAEALTRFCNNRFQTKHKVLCEQSSPYQVIVFQGSVAHVTATEEHDWNGDPVLVINVCDMDISELGMLKRPNRIIWGIALPFWSPCITLGIDARLIRNLTIVVPEQHGLLLEELTSLATVGGNNVCSSCFTHPILEPHPHEECSHGQCATCHASKARCYHAIHCREYISAQGLSAAGLLFGDNDDNFFLL